MTILAKNLDYTELDQESLELRVFRLIDGTFPEWSERSRVNFGNLLVGSFAMVGDVLAFLMDNAAGESRWSTARLRRSLLSLVKLIAYRPASARACTVDVTLTLASPSAGTVTVPAGTQILTDEVTSAIAYQTLQEVVFAVGETSKTASAENSASWSERFASTELPNQVDVLGRVGVLDGSVAVVAADGAYEERTDLLDSKASDRHFVLGVDAQERAAIRYGDGINGAVPKGTRTVTYKTGGGAAGRVEANRLKRVNGTFFDSLGNPVRLTANNGAAAAGGEDRESNAAIKRNAPRSLRVAGVGAPGGAQQKGRAVAREDFEIVAELVPGVARALHLTGNQNAAIGENAGQLFIVPTGGGAPSQALLDAVAGEFDADSGPYPKTNTYQLLVAAAPYLSVSITATVFLAAGYSGPEGRAKARAQALAALGVFFDLTTTNEVGEEVDNQRVNFGYYFRSADGTPANQLSWSDVFNAVRDVAAFRKLDPGPSGFLLNGVRDDVALAAQQFPILGDVVLIDGATGTPF